MSSLQIRFKSLFQNLFLFIFSKCMLYNINSKENTIYSIPKFYRFTLRETFKRKDSALLNMRRVTSCFLFKYALLLVVYRRQKTTESSQQAATRSLVGYTRTQPFYLILVTEPKRPLQKLSHFNKANRKLKQFTSLDCVRAHVQHSLGIRSTLN